MTKDNGSSCNIRPCCCRPGAQQEVHDVLLLTFFKEPIIGRLFKQKQQQKHCKKACDPPEAMSRIDTVLQTLGGRGENELSIVLIRSCRYLLNKRCSGKSGAKGREVSG